MEVTNETDRLGSCGCRVIVGLRRSADGNSSAYRNHHSNPQAHLRTPTLLEEVWSEKYNSEEKADFCFTWSISTTSQKQEAFYNAEMNTLVSWTEFFAFFNGECGA